MNKRPTLAQLQSAINMYAPKDGLAYTPAFMNKTPRKASGPRKHAEHDTQAEMVKYLHMFCPTVIVSASLNGELWSAARHMPKGIFFGWINKLKARGMLPGDQDLTLRWHGPRMCLIETKTKTGREADHQKQLREQLQFMGFAVHICRNLDDLRSVIALEKIPCLESARLTMHPNQR